MRLDKIAIIVDDYDQAIWYFTEALGFDLVEDSPSLTSDGRPKRWVVVRPPDGGTGILLAQADGERQAAAVGNQAAGRVGFFLEVDDFDAAYERMRAAGVEFVTAPERPRLDVSDSVISLSVRWSAPIRELVSLLGARAWITVTTPGGFDGAEGNPAPGDDAISQWTSVVTSPGELTWLSEALAVTTLGSGDAGDLG